MLCLVYNTTGEPLELMPSLSGLVLHLRGKAVVLETVTASLAWSPWVPSRGDLVVRRLRGVM